MKKSLPVLLTLLAISMVAFGQTTPSLPNLTLYADFLNAPNIVNDGSTENTLTIGVFNTALPSTSGTSANDIVFNQGETIYFWFITDDREAGMAYARPWALTNKANLYDSKVQVTAKAPTGSMTKIVSNQVNGRVDLMGYGLQVKSTVTLKPGEHITVTLSGLKSNLPSGPTQGFFFYEKQGFNIVYQQMNTIQKSPVYINQHKVGIATNTTTTADINVGGGIQVEGGPLTSSGNNNVGYAFNNSKNGNTGMASKKADQVGIYSNGYELASFEKEQLQVNGKIWVREANASPDGNEIYYLTSVENNMVWDLYNFSTQPNGDINLANNAYGKNTQQQFTIVPAAEGYVQIKNVNSGLVADFENNKLRQQVQASNKGTQLFKFVPTGEGSYYIECKQYPGKVLSNGTALPSKVIPMFFDNNKKLSSQKFVLAEMSPDGVHLMKLGAKGQFAINKKTKNGKSNLMVNGEPGTTISFGNGNQNNVEINSDNGQTTFRGTTTMQGDAYVGRNSHVGGEVIIGGDWVAKKQGEQLEVKNNKSNHTAFTVSKDGIIRFPSDRPFSQSGISRNGGFIPVPYGTPDDWNIILSPRWLDTNQNDGHADDALQGMNIYTGVDYQRNGWNVHFTMRWSSGGGYSNMDVYKAPSGGNIDVNWLIVRK